MKVNLLCVIAAVVMTTSFSLCCAQVVHTYRRRAIHSLTSAPKPLKPQSPERLMIIAVGAMSVVFRVNILSAMAIVVGVVACARLVRVALQARKLHSYHRDLASALQRAVQCLRSGGGLIQALEQAVEAGGASEAELARVMSSHRSGLPLASAISQWRNTKENTAVYVVSSALLLTTEFGGSPARGIEAGMQALSHAMRSNDLAKTQSTQAQSSAFVLSILPICVLVSLIVTTPRTGHFIFHTNAGAAMFFMGICLDVVSAMVMQRMIQSACA